MPLQFAKGTITWAAAEATGAKTVSGLAFQPKAVMFFSAITDTTGAYVADTDLMFGCSTSASEEWVIHTSDNNVVTTTANARGRSASASIRGDINGANVIDFEADFTTFTSDGFTVNLSNSPSVALVIHYLAIGGSDITNAKAGSMTIPTPTGAFSITDPGFQPSMALFAYTFADGTGMKFSLGITDGTTTLNAHVGNPNSNTVVASHSFQGVGALTGSATNAATLDMDTRFTAFTSTGFDLSNTDGPGVSTTAFYLAIKGGVWKVGTETEGTTATARDTALAFTPTGLLLIGEGAASDATYNTTRNGIYTIGASDGTNEGCIWGGNTDAHVDSPAYKRHDVTRAYWAATPTTVTPGVTTPPTTVNEADSSLAPSKFTLTWTSAGSSREFLYLAGGNTPSLVAQPFRQLSNLYSR